MLALLSFVDGSHHSGWEAISEGAGLCAGFGAKPFSYDELVQLSLDQPLSPERECPMLCVANSASLQRFTGAAPPRRLGRPAGPPANKSASV
jgi:hypothetical protein